jgi:hypothetical protein
VLPSKELVREGQLTKDGKRLAVVEATLGELARLQSIAQRTLEKAALSPNEAALAEKVGAGLEKPAATQETEVAGPPSLFQPVEGKKKAVITETGMSEANRQAERRNNALFEFGNIIDSLRKGEFTGSTREANQRQARQYAAEITDAAVREAELRRIEATGKKLTTDEKLKLAMQLNQQLERLIKQAAPAEQQNAMQQGLQKVRAQAEADIQAAVSRGALQAEMIPLLRREQALRQRQDAIERGMTISDTREGELAALKRGVDETIRETSLRGVRKKAIRVKAMPKLKTAGKAVIKKRSIPKIGLGRAKAAAQQQAKAKAKKDAARAEAEKKSIENLAAMKERVQGDVDALNRSIQQQLAEMSKDTNEAVNDKKYAAKLESLYGMEAANIFENADKAASEAIEKTRNAYERFVRAAAKKLRGDSVILAQLTENLKKAKTEQEVAATKKRLEDFKKAAKTNAETSTDATKEHFVKVKEVLDRIAQGTVKGQRGVRTEQVATTLTPAQEKRVAAIEEQMGLLGSSAEDRIKRAALQQQIDKVWQGAYAPVSKPFAEKAPAASDADIEDLEAEQIAQAGALNIEQREEKPVGRVPPAEEINRVKERYLALQKQGKDKQAKALREKHMDLFLGPLEGLVRGIENREGKQTQADLRTGITEANAIWKPEPAPREATDADTGVDRAEAQAIADRVKAALPSGVDFIYAPTLADAPADLRAFITRTGRKAVKGAVMPDGRVVVIGEAHSSPKDVEETIAHELIGHYGADVVLGPEGMKAMVADMTKKGLDHVAEVATGLGVFPDVATARMAMPKNVDEKVMTVLVREMIAHAAEGRRVAPRFAEKVKTFIRDLISKVRGFFRNAGLSSLARADTKAIQKILNDAEKALSSGRVGVYRTPDGETVFRQGEAYPSSMPQELKELVDATVSTGDARLQDQTRARLMGLAATVAFDRAAPVKLAAEIGVKKGLISEMEAVQNIYYISQHGKRVNQTLDTIQHGPRVLAKGEQDGEVFWQIKRKEGPDNPTLLKVYKALDESGLTPSQYDALFTLFLASNRIKNAGVGITKLSTRKGEDGKPIVTEEKLQKFEKYIASDKRMSDAFEKARKIYNDYNHGLIDFAIQAGYVSKELGAKLKALKDYIPFYREVDGDLQMILDDGSAPITVGNLKDQPYLEQLVGGEDRIQRFFDSSVQNTQMWTEAALRNITTTDTAALLTKLGMVETYKAKGSTEEKSFFKGLGVAGPRVLRFKLDGEDVFVKVKTEGTAFEDIPAELVVKGMEGIKTTFPTALRLLGAPAKLLRRFIVLNLPMYPLRSLVRESLSAWGTSGANFIPIIDPLKNVAAALQGKSKTAELLQKEGLGGGQLLAGMSNSEEVSTLLRSIASGKTTAGTALAWLEEKSMLADTGIRVTAYDSFVKQKMNPVRAWVATNEILDYNRQGLSPGIYVLNTLIPFFNTQLQGLSVMARAMTGRMPMNEKLQIQKKLFQRAATMAAMTLMYTALMQDDEAYENATPEVRMANWFVRMPGVDEPLKIPIPFEFGLLFKSIPETLYNAAAGNADMNPVMWALGKQMLNSIPGGSSLFMPQAMKIGVEQFFGKDAFNLADIETPAMKKLDPAERYKDNTTELAKTLGAFADISPARIDQFIKSVGSQTLLSLVSLTNPLLAGDNPPSASMKTSKLPLVGAAFQPTDAGGIINRVYEQMEEAVQAKNTYTKLLEEGREEKAERYLNDNLNRIMMADSAASFRNEMNQLTSYEKAIRADLKMTPEEKRAELDEVRRLKIETAKQYRAALRDAA